MKRPPRLMVRTMVVTFATVAAILAVVFVVLIVDARDRARAVEAEKLQVSERVFTAFEQRRQQDQLAVIATLAESPTLKAALVTYFTERAFSGLAPEQERALRNTVQLEADKVARVMSTEALAILDRSGTVFVSAGTSRDRWPVGQHVAIPPHVAPAFQSVAALPSGAFRVSGAGLRFLDPAGGGDRDDGTLILATSLDDQYARELSALSRAGVVITVNEAVVASTVPRPVSRALVALGRTPGATGSLDGEEYAIGTLMALGPARVYTLTSIDAVAQAATRAALLALGSIAFGSIMLAVLGSLWLARTVTGPINHVADTIATMTANHDFGRMLALTGSSRELDALASAFNDLMQGLTKAEAATRAAYLGAIRALAAALDARDPYTAGHSERVSALSVIVARQMSLPSDDVEIIRLGALLHDIGKIGLADEILRKPGALTPEEFEQIKRHPGLGAHILKQVAFLAPHLPIVELHHERPDGRGYPFGLRGEEIPLAARIVHVVDAFDAMTSARAYRPARSAQFATTELRRVSGTEFDPVSVEALCSAITGGALDAEPQFAHLAREVA